VSTQKPARGRTDGQLFAAAAAAVARGDDLDDSLAELLGLAAESVAATRGAVYIADRDRDVLELSVTLGVSEATAEETGLVESASTSADALAEAVRSRLPAPIADAGRLPVVAGSASGLVLPLIVNRDGNEVALGVMALGLATELPAAEKLRAAEPLADLAAVAVERALALSASSEQADWFDRLAYTDLVTGLANRRTVDQMLELEVARAGRQGAPIGIAIFELDRLAEIVADAGNAAGDHALKRAAQVLAGGVRLVDTVGRYDRDRFILLAPGPDPMIVVDRLVRAVAALAPIEGHAVAVSAGLACFPEDGRTPEELLEAAEKAVAEARSTGGNRAIRPAPIGN
jgi:diguanylate cyclase (GGDEF)-like protein